MATQIQLRQDTASEWDTNNPTLAIGEVGLILDVDDNVEGIKIGNGSNWIDTPLHVPVMGGERNVLEEDTAAAGTPVSDRTTFLLKGLSGQTAKVFGVEATGVLVTTTVFTIDKLGETDIGGGYNATNDAYGLTISSDGELQTNTSVEVGDFDGAGSTGGVLLSTDVPATADGTEPNLGKVEISALTGQDANKVIDVNMNGTSNFSVQADGTVATTSDITTDTDITATGNVTAADPTLDQHVVTKAYFEDNQQGEYSSNFDDPAVNTYMELSDVPDGVLGSTGTHLLLLAFSHSRVASGYNQHLTATVTSDTTGTSIGSTARLAAVASNNGEGTIYSECSGLLMLRVSPAGHSGNFYVQFGGSGYSSQEGSVVDYAWIF